jgi:riboflavin synthase
MFTGIVEELGTVRAVRPGPAGAQLELDAPLVASDAEIGASISVNGVCLTVVAVEHDHWVADVVAETMARSTLGSLRPGDVVNVERPLRADSRLGGHIVLGHVDATVAILDVTVLADATRELRVELPEDLASFVVEKGSVALDGASLTVTTVGERDFGIALIPHTLAVTTFGRREVGDRCNLEVDYLAKVVQRMAAPYAHATAPAIGGAR